MNRNLGYFTCYGIEYIYDYLGESRIKQRIDELREKPTMGIRLEDFAYKNPEFSYADGTGIFWVFDLLLGWFPDIEFILFLYEKSKTYTEDKYWEGGLLKRKWQEHIDMIDMMLESTPESKVSWESKKINPYWKEFHFFYMGLFKIIKELLRKKKEVELDFIGPYDLNKAILTGKLKLEIKTRRKPLTGEYLLYREGDVYYSLEPKSLDDRFVNYDFIKDKNIYSLKVDKTEAKARIDLVKSNSSWEDFITKLNNINLDTLMTELGENYIRYFKEITNRIKQDNMTYSNSSLLSNSAMIAICDYYESKGDIEKANEYAALNDSYSDVWREIGVCGEQ